MDDFMISLVLKAVHKVTVQINYHYGLRAQITERTRNLYESICQPMWTESWWYRKSQFSVSIAVYGKQTR
jgi:hypothetical protein